MKYLRIKKTSKFYKLIKNLFDNLFSLFILIAFIPLFLIIALLIKLSSRGPIFFYKKGLAKIIPHLNV